MREREEGRGEKERATRREKEENEYKRIKGRRKRGKGNILVKGEGGERWMMNLKRGK
jgi:hypothetical protein